MCGIVGLYTKSPELEKNLGSLVSAMLIQMTDRGPDSAGFAIYHDPVPDDSVKITLQGADDTDWNQIADSIRSGIDPTASLCPVANHAVAIIQGTGIRSVAG